MITKCYIVNDFLRVFNVNDVLKNTRFLMQKGYKSYNKDRRKNSSES